MEAELTPQDPLLVGDATAHVVITPGTVDDIIDKAEDLNWLWQSAEHVTATLNHHVVLVFTQEEVYGDDQDLMSEFLTEDLSDAIPDERKPEITIDLRASRTV